MNKVIRMYELKVMKFLKKYILDVLGDKINLIDYFIVFND